MFLWWLLGATNKNISWNQVRANLVAIHSVNITALWAVMATKVAPGSWPRPPAVAAHITDVGPPPDTSSFRPGRKEEEGGGPPPHMGPWPGQWAHIAGRGRVWAAAISYYCGCKPQ